MRIDRRQSFLSNDLLLETTEASQDPGVQKKVGELKQRLSLVNEKITALKNDNTLRIHRARVAAEARAAEAAAVREALDKFYSKAQAVESDVLARKEQLLGDSLHIIPAALFTNWRQNRLPRLEADLKNVMTRARVSNVYESFTESDAAAIARLTTIRQEIDDSEAVNALVSKGDAKSRNRARRMAALRTAKVDRERELAAAAEKRDRLERQRREREERDRIERQRIEREKRDRLEQERLEREKLEQEERDRRDAAVNAALKAATGAALAAEAAANKAAGHFPLAVAVNAAMKAERDAARAAEAAANKAAAHVLEAAAVNAALKAATGAALAAEAAANEAAGHVPAATAVNAAIKAETGAALAAEAAASQGEANAETQTALQGTYPRATELHRRNPPRTASTPIRPASSPAAPYGLQPARDQTPLMQPVQRGIDVFAEGAASTVSLVSNLVDGLPRGVRGIIRGLEAPTALASTGEPSEDRMTEWEWNFLKQNFDDVKEDIIRSVLPEYVDNRNGALPMVLSSHPPDSLLNYRMHHGCKVHAPRPDAADVECYRCVSFWTYLGGRLRGTLYNGMFGTFSSLLTKNIRNGNTPAGGRGRLGLVVQRHLGVPRGTLEVHCAGS
jgi:hypothetical protein